MDADTLRVAIITGSFTLAGALVVFLGSAISSSLADKRRYRHELLMDERAERRKTYIAYLEAYDELIKAIRKLVVYWSDDDETVEGMLSADADLFVAALQKFDYAVMRVEISNPPHLISAVLERTRPVNGNPLGKKEYDEWSQLLQLQNGFVRDAMRDDLAVTRWPTKTPLRRRVRLTSNKAWRRLARRDTGGRGDTPAVQAETGRR